MLRINAARAAQSIVLSAVSSPYPACPLKKWTVIVSSRVEYRVQPGMVMTEAQRSGG